MNAKPTKKELDVLTFTIRLLAELMQVSPEPEKKLKLSEARDTLGRLRHKCQYINTQGTLLFTRDS